MPATTAPFGGNPLEYSDASWLLHRDTGGQSTGDSVNLGRQNDLGISGPPGDLATIVTIQNGEENAAFAALNGGGNPATGPVSPGAGGVGVFGQSIAGGIDEDTPPPSGSPRPPMTKGIGVAGHCNTGCGVYGQSFYGAGVVGFTGVGVGAVTGWGKTAAGLHPTFQNAGVFGQNHGVSGETPLGPVSDRKSVV